MWQSYFLWVLYLITIKIGIIGNLWVIFSIICNTRPQIYSWLRQPSDRLRSNIFVLAFVDFFVVCSLALRVIYVWDDTLTFEIWNCRGLYFVEQLSKTISMFCLVFISIRRYIIIRKPFNDQHDFPTVTLLLCFLILITMLLTVKTIDATADKRDCRISTDSAWNRLIGLLVGTCFVLLLIVVSINYTQIVLHVHRKFSKRKARQSAICNNKRYQLSEPRYVREMTSSIIRVAVFHIICWLPFCFLVMIPTESSSMVLVSIRTISWVNDKHVWVLWVPILVNWLTYLNSALNWIFYAMLNRDLRELIRKNMKRRRRNAITYNYLSANFTNKCSRQSSDQSLSMQVSTESPQS